MPRAIKEHQVCRCLELCYNNCVHMVWRACCTYGSIYIWCYVLYCTCGVVCMWSCVDVMHVVLCTCGVLYTLCCCFCVHVIHVVLLYIWNGVNIIHDFFVYMWHYAMCSPYIVTCVFIELYSVYVYVLCCTLCVGVHIVFCCTLGVGVCIVLYGTPGVGVCC